MHAAQSSLGAAAVVADAPLHTLCERCPEEATALFLYRKPEATPPQPVVLPTPAEDATAEEAGRWIADFSAKLQECANTGKAPAKGEGEGAEEGADEGKGKGEGEDEGEGIEVIDRPAKVPP